MSDAEWQPRELRCQCGVAAREFAESAVLRRQLRRMYANADGKLPACPACDDRHETVETRDQISLSMRGDREGVRAARAERWSR